MTIISTIRNFLASKVMSRVLNDWSDQSILLKKREKFELIRKKEGRQHQVFYFHELSDPYSHITAQLISKLNKNYDIDLIPLLVGDPPKATVHEPNLYRKYCLSDALRIAPFYQVEFPSSTLPEDNLILLGQRVLSSLDKDNFINSVAEISNFVWSGNQEALEALVDDKTLSKQGMLSVISSNEEKRDKVEAYMGSTFSYEGELYWGVDRLDYLEERLIDLGLKNNLNKSLISEKKQTIATNIPQESNLELEFYPSLNSPYTSIVFERVKELESSYPIKIITKPVLPMLMRNMTIPRYKAKYIFKDTAREARKYGVPFGKVKSPLGKPAERAYSLFPWIDQQGKGFEYIYRLMIASFRKGEDIGKKRYLRKLIEDLQLEWNEAEKHLDSDGWKEILEKNRLIMYEGRSWGVPTFKLVDGENNFTTWGQDRIWLVEEEIIKRLKQ